tara:strand:+ start:2678 stop:3103 length:426 start_codon:yes stop_codon:yes gene_type:complete
MTVLDIGNNVAVTSCHPPVSNTAATTREGTAVDTKGATWAMFVVDKGVIGATTIDAELVECDTIGGTYTTVKQIDGTTDADFTEFGASASAVEIAAVDCRRTQRFLKVKLTQAGTGASLYSIDCVLMPDLTRLATDPIFNA